MSKLDTDHLSNCPRCGARPRMSIVYGMTAVICTGCGSAHAERTRDLVEAKWQLVTTNDEDCAHCGHPPKPDPIILNLTGHENTQSVIYQCSGCKNAVGHKDQSHAWAAWINRANKGR